MLRKLFYAVLGAVFTLGIVWAAQQPLPGVNGPTLGDPLSNLYSLTQAYVNLAGLGNHTGLSVSQTSAQANCTQLDNNALQNVSTSSSTGYVCLPTAYSGKVVMILNSTSSTIDIYSSAISFTPGTADTINTTAGTSAYTGLTTHKITICAAVANGAWGCGSIS